MRKVHSSEKLDICGYSDWFLLQQESFASSSAVKISTAEESAAKRYPVQKKFQIFRDTAHTAKLKEKTRLYNLVETFITFVKKYSLFQHDQHHSLKGVQICFCGPLSHVLEILGTNFLKSLQILLACASFFNSCTRP